MPFALVAALAGCASPTPITWHGDVAPLVNTHCARCHSADGVAPAWITDPTQAVARADTLRAWVDSGAMSPPASDPACRDYVDAEHRWLDPADRQRIVDWVDQGALLGDPPAEPLAPPPPLATLASPDAWLSMPDPYTLETDDDDNKYMCFVLDVDTSEPFYITGLELTPGNPAIVHHAVLFQVEESDPAEDYDNPAGQQAFDCRAQTGAALWTLMHGWAPGTGATIFPEGTGLPVHADARLVLQVHYYEVPGADRTDRSRYAVTTASEVDRPIAVYIGGAFDFRIPPFVAEHTHHNRTRNVRDDVDILGVLPHMHRRGRAYAAEVERDSGETCLVEGQFDFDNQYTYLFKEPVPWNQGDTLHTTCVWDNSATDREVTYGEATDEEMCVFFSYVAPR
ncbi:MAG: hypothetical protein H6739_07690 [Alphaproteobacteria bacterium]|nr:hypothetical protein [Alphaproteobacteria bacterium]